MPIIPLYIHAFLYTLLTLIDYSSVANGDFYYEMQAMCRVFLHGPKLSQFVCSGLFKSQTN